MRTAAGMLIGLALVAALGTAGPAAAQDSRTVRVSFPSEDGSLTPYTFMTGYPLVMLVYDSLAWRDEGGVARPWLASSIRRGGDGRTVTVRLRSGIRWHDGRPFSADDVVFTYRHMADREHPRFTPQLRDIDSVTAPDARTVVFTLRRASLGFADQPLADVPILPRHVWEGLAEGQSAPSGLPIGTGPYRLVRHAAGGSYSFQANRRYFKGRPAVDVLQVPIVTKEEDAFSMLRRGSLDAAPVNFPAGASAGRPRGIRFAEGNSYNGTMLEFNLTRAPFAALEARRTIARALRLNAIAGNKNGPGAMATAEYGMLHPDSPWASRTQLHRSDVAAARLSLAEQRIQPFTIIASTSDGVRLEAARRIAGMLREAGAQVEVEELPARQFDRRVGRGEVTPDFDAAVVGIPTLASYDPAYLRNVFGDPQRATLNDTGYRSARFERLADAVASATTRRARRAAVGAELELLAQDLPAVPLFFGGTTFAYRSIGYGGWVDVEGSGILDKQSFLAATVREPAGARPAPAAGDPRDTTEDEDGISLVPIIIGLVALLILGAVWASRSRATSAPRPPRGR